jgi:hypothetical protein
VEIWQVAMGAPVPPMFRVAIQSRRALVSRSTWDRSTAITVPETMSGRFVRTSLVPPPEDQTLMCRNEGSVFDAYKSKLFGHWNLLHVGIGGEIPEPKEWWLSDTIAAEFNITVPEPATSTAAQPQHRPAQGVLNFTRKDSGKLSRARTGQK